VAANDATKMIDNANLFIGLECTFCAFVAAEANSGSRDRVLAYLPEHEPHAAHLDPVTPYTPRRSRDIGSSIRTGLPVQIRAPGHDRSMNARIAVIIRGAVSSSNAA